MRKAQVLAVRISATDGAMIRHAAGRMGLSVSELVRRAALATAEAVVGASQGDSEQHRAVH